MVAEIHLVSPHLHPSARELTVPREKLAKMKGINLVFMDA
jgi:hypothetical protein